MFVSVSLGFRSFSLLFSSIFFLNSFGAFADSPAVIAGDPGYGLTAGGAPMDDSNPLRMPYVGDHQLRVITPTLLELTLITTTSPSNALPAQWVFADTAGNLLTLPALAQCVVTANNLPVPVTGIGFKRRVLYAPLRQWDLRIANYLYLQLATPIAAGAAAQVLNPDTTLWAGNVLFTNAADPLRYSPAIHVNQVGYIPNLPKKAMIGYYLGSLGELNTSLFLSFSLVDAHTGATVYSGSLAPNPDIGYSYTPTPYQQVLEADFSSFQTPGEYKLVVPNLGASFPFFIDPGIAGAFARTYELGIYGQRCGTNNVIPYSRFTHGSCHTNPASVPLTDPSLTFVNNVLNQESLAGTNNALETAPRMTNIWASLYPYVNTNAVDTRGGHHDAGDYSKYTTSIANFVHCLTFAVDAFPGVKNLDNLGIPESGDGISDVIQEAKWEADYLAKLQDADGGFYFIVYPATRQYEGDVLPDHGDPQIVLPKNTACTAAAVAALAEIGSSPTFKAAYPTVASNYLVKAVAGWGFLTNAIAKYGRNGSYQTITFSGDWMMHNDELAWAAAALFAATGDPQYDNDLRTNTPDPTDPSLQRWNWLSMYACYGNAFRTYAFAARSGRLQASQLNAAYLAACETEIKTAGTNAVVWSGEMAYGSSFSIENKGLRVAGWYFSGEQTFDPAVAYLIDPQPMYLDVILKNFNYEMGCNPVNVSYLTGTGWKRQREIVDQYAQNDYRVLPPSGIPLGNITANFYWTGTYQTELDALCFPSDEEFTAPYPMYDRWADAYNVSQEFVVSQETARSLVGALSLMAMSSVTNQPWNSATAYITGLPAQASATTPVTASLNVPGLDLSKARVVWEAAGQDPYIGTNFTFIPSNIGKTWVEVEAMLPDGRRVVALTNYYATVPSSVNVPLNPNPYMVAFYRLNGNFSDAMRREPDMTPAGNATLDPIGLNVQVGGDHVSVSLKAADVIDPNTTQAISVEAKVYISSYDAVGIANATVLSLSQGWQSQMAVLKDKWRAQPDVLGGTQIIVPGATLANYLTPRQWHVLNLMLDKTGYTVTIDGQQVFHNASADLSAWSANGTILLQAGDFNGWLIDIVVRNYRINLPANLTAPPNPHALSLNLDTNNFYHFHVAGLGTTPYNVLTSTDLLHWSPIFVNYFGGPMDYIDTQTTNFPQRFYRATSFTLSIPSLVTLPADSLNRSQVYLGDSHGVPYILQASTDLLHWTSIYTNLTGNSMIYSDPGSLANPGRVYRIQLMSLQPVMWMLSNDAGGNPRVHTETFVKEPYVIDTSADLHYWWPLYTNQLGGPLDYTDTRHHRGPINFYRARFQTGTVIGVN